MANDTEKMKAVWRQKNTPVLYRKGKGFPLLLRLPYHKGNRIWLQNERRNKPVWVSNKKHWEIPKAWFNDTVNRGLERWGQLYIIQPYRKQEKCSPACQDAKGHECQCSCMGEHHGSQHIDGGWFIVSDTFATKWGSTELACRLLDAKNGQ